MACNEGQVFFFLILPLFQTAKTVKFAVIILIFSYMATFKFVFRPSMKTGHHPGSLSLRIIHGRRPKTVGLSLRLYSEEWNGTTQTVVFPDDAPERTGYLQDVQERITACAGKVDDIIRQLDLKLSLIHI